MSLSSIINKAVSTAFVVIDDLKVKGNADYTIYGVYDTATLKDSTVDSSDDNIDIIQYDFTAMEKDSNSVTSDDQKFLIQTSDLTQDIKSYHTIKVGTKVWNIKDIILKESSDSVVVFHMRLQSD